MDKDELEVSRKYDGVKTPRNFEVEEGEPPQPFMRGRLRKKAPFWRYFLFVFRLGLDHVWSLVRME